ncbi:helix-turn-helix transcriptional regulator [Candidatus Finniella inopinata]|nr:helix-turn-helix transcriptional regulator [Candidatus Finniella inopinata]
MEKWQDFDVLKKKWLEDQNFKETYDALELDYKVVLELIKARSRAGLTQEALANKMGTTQSVIARLESGKTLPSLKTLHKYAEATGSHVQVHIR